MTARARARIPERDGGRDGGGDGDRDADGERAVVHLGDALDVARGMADESCQLVYLDPPFFTQRRHRLVTRARDRAFAFDDAWDSPEAYEAFLRARVIAFHRVLANTGSLFFHCDRRASAIARRLLDDVFGEAMFQSEIVWTYRRWSNARRGLLPSHQTIYWYAKTPDFTFNPAYEAYSPSTNVDQLMSRRERDADGVSVYARDASGALLPSGPKRGVPLGDVWDIPYLNPKAGERVGYPTQKPVLLLSRIVQLATAPDDTVFDPFCGSGTTLVAAALAGRRAIGADVSPDAVALARRRLVNPAESRTRSRLFEVGRSSYERASDPVLGLLHGAGNAHERVQREGESLEEALEALGRAARGKGARVLAVIAVSAIPEGFEAPQGFVVLPSPVSALRALGRER